MTEYETPSRRESDWLVRNGWEISGYRDGDWHVTASNGKRTVKATAISKEQAVGECYRAARYGN